MMRGLICHDHGRGRAREAPVRAAFVAALLAGAAALLPTGASAQALCSGPHSSPVIVGSQVGALAAGAGWAQFVVYHTGSESFFDSDGRRRAFPARGDVRTTSLYLTSAIGVGRGFELGAQATLHRLVFSDATARSERTGLGDIRLMARYSPAAVSWPLALRAAVKLPGSEFPVDATLIPLTEGQRDWELAVDGGAILGAGAYVAGSLGHRWREENRSIARKPGDELFARAELGQFLGSLRWSFTLEGLRGAPPVQQGLELPSARRRLVQVFPALEGPFGPGRLEGSARVSVAGRNLPTGPAVSLAYVLPFTL